MSGTQHRAGFAHPEFGEVLIKTSDCSAIILAGGQAKRMGRDKRFLKVRRRPLLEAQVDLLSTLFDEVIISANDPDRLDYLGLTVYPDEWSEGGPMAGLATGLRHIQNEWAFVLAVDIPEPDQELLSRMCAEKSKLTVIPRHANGNLEPLHALYSRSLLNMLSSQLQSGDYALHRMIKQVDASYIELPEGYDLQNLNTPADYQRFWRSD